MANLDAEICLRFKEARKEKGLSQSLLAGQVGCKQPALSAFENGDSTKLGDSIVKKLAEKLGVSLDPVAKVKENPPEQIVVPGIAVRGFCPDANCPSNIPYMVGDRLYFKTLRGKASPNGGTRCACCGEVLETRCPVCGAPLNDGACCGACGSKYVTGAMPSGIDVAEWAAARRAEIIQLSSF